MDATNTAPTTAAVKLAAALSTTPQSAAAVLAATGLGKSTVRNGLAALVKSGKATRHDADGAYTYTSTAADQAAAAQAAAPAQEAAAPADNTCHCGDDTVGHTHTTRRARRSSTGTTRVSKDAAWAAVTATLTAAGADGVDVPTLWAALMAEGLALTGAYNLVNARRTAGDLVTTVDHREVRSRKYALATAVTA